MDIILEIRKIIREVILKEYYEDEEEYGDDEHYMEDEGEQYFTPTISNEIKGWSHKYEGRNVVWYGDPDQMIVIHKDQIEGMFGNIYDPAKMRYIVKLISDYPEKIELECSYGIGGIIDIIDIKEEQNAVAEDRFDSDYDGKIEAASTGSEELDQYAGKNIEDMDFAYSVGPEALEFFENHKFDVIGERYTPEQLKEGFMAIGPDEDEVEAFGEFINLEIALKSAKVNEEGDFNKFVVQLRDGHHRIMGAIKAGEEYVCLNLAKEDIPKFKGRYQKV